MVRPRARRATVFSEPLVIIVLHGYVQERWRLLMESRSKALWIALALVTGCTAEPGEESGQLPLTGGGAGGAMSATTAGAGGMVANNVAAGTGGVAGTITNAGAGGAGSMMAVAGTYAPGGAGGMQGGTGGMGAIGPM